MLLVTANGTQLLPKSGTINTIVNQARENAVEVLDQIKNIQDNAEMNSVDKMSKLVHLQRSLRNLPEDEAHYGVENSKPDFQTSPPSMADYQKAIHNFIPATDQDALSISNGLTKTFLKRVAANGPKFVDSVGDDAAVGSLFGIHTHPLEIQSQPSDRKGKLAGRQSFYNGGEDPMFYQPGDDPFFPTKWYEHMDVIDGNKNLYGK